MVLPADFLLPPCSFTEFFALRFGRQARTDDTHHGAKASLCHGTSAPVTQYFGVRRGVVNGPTRGIVVGWQSPPIATLRERLLLPWSPSSPNQRPSVTR